MKKTTRSIPSKRSYLPLVSALIIIAIALFLLKNSFSDNKKKLTSSPTGTQEPAHSPAQPAPTAADSALAPPPATPETPLPSSPPLAPETSTDTSCQKTTDDLQVFFKHLEDQDYIKAYALNAPIQETLSNIVTKILTNPPINEKETADLLTVLKNAAHFFRILGLKDLSLIRDIMKYEQPRLEQQLASFYAWSMIGKECQDKSAIKIRLPLIKTYEYAAYFLNTLGGRSYLSRRHAALRVLTKYYCVLILSQASKQSINKYNIDLPYHIKAVTTDINNSDFLENHSLYLQTLQKISAKN